MGAVVGRKLIFKDLIRSSCSEKNLRVDQHERAIGGHKILLRLHLIAPNWASPQPSSELIPNNPMERCCKADGDSCAVALPASGGV